MNQNFLGAPSREDLQVLETLRGRIMPMIGVLDKVHNDMQNHLFRGEALPNPDIMRMYRAATSQLASVNEYINGFYKHREEVYRDANGRPMIDQQGNQRMRYIDTADEGHAERVEALHVFPQAPFPMHNEGLAGLASTLLNKRLEPPEERWVEDRLRKAAEFAYVPSEWKIEPKRSDIKTENEEDDDSEGYVADISTKRFKGTLNEDDLVELWSLGHKTAFDKKYQEARQFVARLTGGEVTDEGGAENDDQTPDGDEDMEDDEEEEEFEDVETPRGQAPEPVVIMQRALPSVHKPVPGAPMLNLGIVHRFMASGEVAQAGQR
ncbi:hypothetical protein HBH70_228780 [Parastagonospora nodorum]|nr:hypothetical protein HBH53_219380 [Parastagonospora nodorum]KAH3986847.1 hypothetical protein HBH51_015160 [Parastagonospora nodorum]KAH4020216.1 hypothetical protein HBI09_182340 [Parastagonospora nodorum]KAH4060329.1 hypothetical protein HBH49_000530 [Parastagonospora nodorum]KAH4156600.1 hypothetical protein HBH43_205680 [Parastagonospora nodorum]